MPRIVLKSLEKEQGHLDLKAINPSIKQVKRTVQVCHRTACLEWPKKSASCKVCVNCLKNTSIAQRLLYNSEIEDAFRRSFYFLSKFLWDASKSNIILYKYQKRYTIFTKK